jgi:GT2 family glycosyltransferase
MATNASKSPRLIDFLSHAFRAVGGVARTVDGFRTTTPWAIARFGSIRLSRGWWTLTSEGEDEDLEVRVRDDTGLIFACRPSRLGGINLHVGQSTIADIDLVLSPWPGEVRFKNLSFKRMTTAEVARFIGRRVTQAMRSDRPLSRISTAARRMMSGSSFGSRAAASSSTSPDAATESALPASTSQAIHRNDLTCVLGDTDCLDARTLNVVADLFRSRPEVAAVYGDVVEGGSLLPNPQWDEERARWFTLGRPPIFFRNHVEGLDPDSAWARVQEIVRISGEASVARIPLPLAVRPAADRSPAPLLPVPVRTYWPKVSIIIPTKQRTDLLAKCLESLRARTDYPDLEIVVVDNGADGAQLGALLKAEGAFHRIVCVHDGGDFNFSRLINGGVRASQGEVLLLFNDDVMAIEPGWLHRMVDSVLDPATGAVGARLVYSSGEIQHAGVMLGLGGICGHLWRNQSAEEAACNPHIVCPGRRMAVTGACLAVRRDAFDNVGGLDEVNYPVTLNDIDFCLRLDRAGFHTIYRGDAVLLHDESQSRGNDNEERCKRERRRAETRAFRQMWGDLLDDDPFGSPAFDLSTETGDVHIPALRLAGCKRFELAVPFSA